ncbi:hypothetical protein IPL68_06055 [Candidatus Saccharibacteria bacterium]|nr:MAG: hypothetical protein IPL68_06055 [Candidatus Saccharibacteria bacterium]
MNFEESPEFAKDVKRLAKKWRSIPSDVQAAKQYILPLYAQLSDDVDLAEYRREFSPERQQQSYIQMYV